MQILRLPPYPLSITYDVPDANTEYLLIINQGTRNVNEVEENITSDSNAQITYTLSNMFNSYDESYYLAIYSIVDGE